MGAPQQWDWLVQIKLQPPLPRSDVIPRPRLLVVLRDAVTTHRLTLLSAPAGYGKTTLLTTLPSTCLGLPLTWLTLDEGDNDPALFLAYLIAALQRLDPACGTTAQTLLAELPNPAGQVHRIVGVLINDILETLPTPFALVLDDVHLVTEPAAHAALDYLLEHLPLQMHLVISTRRDPPLALARLRARGQMAELRVADLRFTLKETAAFLNEQLHLGLSPDDLAALQARAEGWAAGLRLLAVSLDRISVAASRRAFIHHLAQTDRYVFDFLAEEVLRRQDEAVRTFLLETSILPELTPALCEAVTGRQDASAMLDKLDRQNLFVVALDQARKTFRYHALFAEFLRQRLAREMPQRVAELHHRAATAQMTPKRAIGHYLAAEMWPEAAQAIERVGGELLYEGLVDTLVGWIYALPDPVREVHPRLSYLLGMCTWQMGDIDAAQSLQEQALQGFEAIGDEAGQGEVLTEMAGYAIMQADFGRMGEMIHRALAYPIPPLSRVQLLMGRTWLGIFSGELIQAAADWEATLVVLQETAGSDVLRVLLGYLNPLLAALPGGVERIERVLRQAVPHFGDQISPARVFIERNMAFVHFWRGRPAQAIQAGESALAVSERLGGTPPLDAVSAAVVAVAHAVQSDDAAADHFFDLLFHQIEWLAVERLFEVGFLYLLGRTRSLQGRQEEARQVYERMETLSGPFELSFVSVLRLRMQALLGMANRRYAEAERVLRQAVKMEPEATFSILFGSARLMLARLYLEQNCLQEALAEVAPLLAECERQDTPGRILQEGAIVVPVLRLAAARGVHASFAARLLTLLDVERKPQPVYVQETGETLTRREVEVLQLMATGVSNRIIAEQLVISEHTVKSHVSHILRKLDVSSRVQAAARARELGIRV